VAPKAKRFCHAVCVGDQIVEAMREHLGIMTEGQTRGRVAELFELVGIDPATSSSRTECCAHWKRSSASSAWP
jgi:ABC-type dipeptide/oligopeptide/nickel transport system ATPase component